MAGYTPGMPRRRTPPLWGQNIKRLLDEQGLSATAVAAKAEMGLQQFSNLTNDPDLNPTIDSLQRIAKALGVPLAALFTVTGHGRTETPASPVPPDPEVLRAELRTVIAEILSDAINGLARAGATIGGPSPSASAQEAEDGDVSARTGRAVRG